MKGKVSHAPSQRYQTQRTRGFQRSSQNDARSFQRRSSPPCSPLIRQALARWVPHVMRCKNPYVGVNMQAFGCGQCLPCRINKRREWAHRIMLEAAQYEDNSFITLTYADPEHGPPIRSLIQSHGRNWLKRLRVKLEPIRIRYFLVGEYGDQSQRPHYHAALFNFPACEQGFTVYRRGRDAHNCCEACRVIASTWEYGNTYNGRLEPHSAAYVAGYVTKKWTKVDDPRLEGRHPEYARMSLKPGLGADLAPDLASAVLSLPHAPVDVPTSLMHGKRQQPLGRYLVRKVREQSGRSPNAPLEVLQARKEKLRDMYETAENTKLFSGFTKRDALKNAITEYHSGLHAQIEAKEKIWKQRKTKI